jgi:hypothetical protein
MEKRHRCPSRGNDRESLHRVSRDRELEVDGTRVLPLETFLRRLHAGEIVG